MRLLLLVPGAALLGAGLIHCLSDPRANESVTVISTCDLTQLNDTPTSPESALKRYVEAAQGLATASSAAAAQLTQVCNAITVQLGGSVLDAGAGDGGSDPVTACQLIETRGQTITSKNPFLLRLPDPYRFAAGPVCNLDPTAQTTCLATCSPTCDYASNCKGTLQGSCSGKCTGTCSTTGKAVSCEGVCLGTCSDSASACKGECAGACADFYPMQGECSIGCTGALSGELPTPGGGPLENGYCGGTCTGTCTTGNNTVNANGGYPPDAGPDGAIDFHPDASGAPGNCPWPGVCNGWCDKNWSGWCIGGCLDGMGNPGKYSQAECIDTCTGTCTAGGGSGCTSANKIDGGPPVTCDGTCQVTSDAGASCSGTCLGTCSTTMTQAQCISGLDGITGEYNCGQNTECDLACQAKAGLSVTCTSPDTVEVDAVSDPFLYKALKDPKNGPALAVVLQTIAILRTSELAIDQRTVADFAAIGATTDLDRACVALGNSYAQQAHVTLQALANADPSVVQTDNISTPSP